jgi:hypothetical protein
VKSVTDLAEAFYGDVLQNIRAWKAPPPKLKRATEEEAVEAVAELVGAELSDVAAEELSEDLPDDPAEFLEAFPADVPEGNDAGEPTNQGSG